MPANLLLSIVIITNTSIMPSGQTCTSVQTTRLEKLPYLYEPEELKPTQPSKPKPQVWTDIANTNCSFAKVDSYIENGERITYHNYQGCFLSPDLVEAYVQLDRRMELGKVVSTKISTKREVSNYKKHPWKFWDASNTVSVKSTTTVKHNCVSV